MYMYIVDHKYNLNFLKPNISKYTGNAESRFLKVIARFA